MNLEKTIAAVSTPFGKGGIAVIRVSGKNTIDIVSKIFASKSGKAINEYKSGFAIYGSFHDSEGVFDDGLLTFFKSPRSFTGEDTAELSCHGGILVTQRLLNACLSAGAEYAGPGEFTKRAFINGKISLSQAEAVGGIIDAITDKHLSVSANQSRGSLSLKINDISNRLVSLAASVYAYIDYPDEDMTDVSIDEMRIILSEINNDIKKLMSSFKYGKAISEGVNTVIVGRPNMGKSSIMNFFAGYDRALVSDIAGTTRDVVTEKIRFGDIILNVADTAGLHSSLDIIEKMGMEKSVEYIKNSDLVLIVADAYDGLVEDDLEVINQVKEAGKEECSVLLFNKTDKCESLITHESPIKYNCYFSAISPSDEQINELKEIISTICGEKETDLNSEIIINARQFSSLNKAYNAIQNAIYSLEGFTQDIAGFDIEEAISALSELEGRKVSEVIVDEIFSKFCVGK
jgi:tRNA modification GTPase